MTVHPDYTIETWGPYTINGVAYGGMTVLGFLHDAAFAQKQTDAQNDTLHAQALLFSLPSVHETRNDAKSVGFPLQACQSVTRKDSFYAFDSSDHCPFHPEGLGEYVPPPYPGPTTPD
jgi:hypothetical protein